ncbi:unnamed protein product [Colias eurytheme]|nr:unnamed protein product [Colias eurytheme]
MRMERIKTGGGPPGYFPPDEILDRVAALLGSTGEGLTVRFGGDAEPQLIDETSTLVKLGVDCPINDWRQSVKDIVKPTAIWPVAFKQCKRFILQRSKKLDNVLIRGELFYKNDLATPANVCRKKKYMNMINPRLMAVNVAINKNKLIDINKLLGKHFGANWRELPTLSFYKELLLVQEQLTTTYIPEENYCEERLDEANDLRI